jgi:hypothetical protein
MYVICGGTCWPIGVDIATAVNTSVKGPNPDIRMNNEQQSIPEESSVCWNTPDHPHSDELRELIKSLPSDALSLIRENPRAALSAIYLEVALNTGKQMRTGESTEDSFKAGDAISSLMQYYNKCK